NMDAAITHGEKDWVRFSGHSDQSFLDCVGGFGVNVLGHNHPKLTQAAIEFLQSPAVAIADQGTSQPEAERFCRDLSQQLAIETGREYRIVLVNGGAEAVDLSLRHAYLAWKERHEIYYQKELARVQKFRPELLGEFVEKWSLVLNDPDPAVLTLDHAYHGNSVSGLRFTDSDERRNTFQGLAPFAVHVLDSGKADWRSRLRQITQQCTTPLPVLRQIDGEWKLTTFSVSRLIGAIAEPVRGEGGIEVRRDDVLDALRE
ncbi:MAG: aminotransferase class III-fold pyridoxal phosphate-dependent enzyme, partial [Planctomycetaceae bacterium]|nr:aminotransferase class III-fold pyridoxal phosphate-dependent enzyme [Planctomycetaceae bacterium]